MRPRRRSRGAVSLVLSFRLACALALLSFASAPAQSPVAAGSKVNPDLQALAETERAFAALGAEKGVRESFMAYFAPEGIWFVPHPKQTIDDLRSRPAPAGPPPRKLEWAPMYGDVARAGDLGYDTGPSKITDLTGQQQPRYGYFFSIWKKQPGGEWRVALDLGTQNPADEWDPAAPPAFRAAPPSGWEPATKPHAPQPDARQHLDALLAAEAAASQASQRSGMAAAYAKWLDADARFHRNFMSPVVGGKVIAAYLRQHDAKAHWQPSEAFTARSGDLGYTYGKYWAPGIGKAGAEETGYYVHVWRRNARGDWKLVFDVNSPTPFDAK